MGPPCPPGKSHKPLIPAKISGCSQPAGAASGPLRQRASTPAKLRRHASKAFMLTFQQIILTLQSYWDNKGCALLQPIDMEVGAGTSHVHTFLRAIGPEPWRAAYVQPSRRPKDGRYGDNPNRLQHYYQYQVVLKPPPHNILAFPSACLKPL